MKRVILPATALAAFALSTSSFAADTADNAAVSTKALSAQVNQLSAQTKKLEHEVQVLKNKKKAHIVRNAKATKVAKSVTVGTENPWSHFVTVTTTPFLGRSTDFDGDDLLFNVSSNNEDLRLLKQKQQIDNEMSAQGYSLDRPILQLSGAVEGLGFSQSGFGTSTTSGISLSSAELDMNAIASSWASAYMTMDFNGAPISSGNRAPNSTIYLGRGFATIGNLNRFPVYFTAGLMYVPFGRYANDMVSTPLTLSLGRIRTPAALLGFSLNNGLYGSVYGFSGSQTSGGQPMFKQWGLNGGYKYTFGTDDFVSAGAGWVSNMADAQGQQNTGLSTTAGQFGGFGVSTPTSTNNNLLVHNVHAADGHADLTMGPVSLIGEYLSAVERYATADMTYNAQGAEPSAAHAEIDYLLPFFAKKYGTTVGVAYGHTAQALALNLPENSYSTFLSTSIWRETTESLEFRHDTDYATTAVATGRGAGATANITGTGRARNSVLAQVGVYF